MARVTLNASRPWLFKSLWIPYTSFHHHHVSPSSLLTWTTVLDSKLSSLHSTHSLLSRQSLLSSKCMPDFALTCLEPYNGAPLLCDKVKTESSYLLSPSPPLWPSFRTCFLAVPSRAITQRLWAIAPSSVKWREGSPSAKEIMCAKAQDVYGRQEAKRTSENGSMVPFPPASFSVCFLISA